MLELITDKYYGGIIVEEYGISLENGIPAGAENMLSAGGILLLSAFIVLTIVVIKRWNGRFVNVLIGKASDEQTIKIIDIESALIGRIKSYGMVDDAKVIVSFNGKNAVIAANIYRGDKSFRCEVKGEDVYIERMMDKLVRQILHKLA